MAGQRVDGYQAFRRYFSIKQHFESQKFNLFTGSRIRYTKAAFDKRHDSKIFDGLAYDYLVGDLSNFFMANVVEGNTHVSEMTDLCFREWKAKMNALHYLFEEDLKIMRDIGVDFRELWKSISGGLPLAIQLLNGNHIKLETVCLVDLLTRGSIIEMLDEQITDKFIYPDIRNKIIKYQPFIRYDEKEFKNILKRYL